MNKEHTIQEDIVKKMQKKKETPGSTTKITVLKGMNDGNTQFGHEKRRNRTRE